MSVKISELPVLDTLADNDVLAGVDTSANVTSKVTLSSLKEYIDTNTTYTGGTNIDITNNVISAPNVYNKTETDNLLSAKESLANKITSISSSSTNVQYPSAKSVYNHVNTTKTQIEETLGDVINETKGELDGDIEQLNNEVEELQSEIDSLSTIFNAFPTESDEDESMTLDGTAEVKFKKFDLKGNTSQDGTPTPSSPIPVNVVSGDNEINIVGKNLYDGLYTAKKYISYATGTLQNSDNWSATDYIVIEPNTTYTLSGITNSGWVAGTSFYDSSKTFISSVYSTTYTFTTPSNAKYLKLSLNSETPTNVMLEKGSSATTYEPYQGNTYNIDLPVENLANITILNQVPSISNGQLTSLSGGACTDMIEIDNTINYILSTTVSSSATPYVAFYDSNSSYLGTKQAVNSNSTGYLLNTSEYYSNCKYIRLRFDEYAKYLTIQLEKGSKANSYTPYGTTPIELCSNQDGTLRDYFLHDKTLDKWYWHREVGKVVLNGNETNWSTRGGGTTYAYSVPNIFDGDKTIGLCTHWNFIQGGASNLQTNECIASANTNTSLSVFTNNSSLDTLANLKTWLGVNKPSVYYVLATPTTTEITYQPLIDQLNLLEKAMSKEGQTNISQVNNDKPFIINAEAILSLKNVLDRVTLLES